MINDPIKNFIGFWSGLILVLILAFWFHAQLRARDRDRGPAQQHEWIDSVLVPKFGAAWSEWALLHPQDKPGARGTHWHTIDAGDVQRGHVMRVAMKELYDRLAELGY